MFGEVTQKYMYAVGPLPLLTHCILLITKSVSQKSIAVQSLYIQVQLLLASTPGVDLRGKGFGNLRMVDRLSLFPPTIMLAKIVSQGLMIS